MSGRGWWIASGAVALAIVVLLVVKRKAVGEAGAAVLTPNGAGAAATRETAVLPKGKTAPALSPEKSVPVATMATAAAVAAAVAPLRPSLSPSKLFDELAALAPSPSPSPAPFAGPTPPPISGPVLSPISVRNDLLMVDSPFSGGSLIR